MYGITILKISHQKILKLKSNISIKIFQKMNMYEPADLQ